MDKKVKSENIKWHEQSVSTDDKEKLHGHKGITLWFTGLSGSGKSTLANAVEFKLHDLGVSTFILDGDNVRYGLNSNLGFSPEDRNENIRRVSEVAKLFSTAGIVNLSAFISPYRKDRDFARKLQPETFIEVYCDVPVNVCEDRDPKGLYKKARAGEIKGFTGIDAPYEAPVTPEISVDTSSLSIEKAAQKVIDYLISKKIINTH